jgi:SAM-dependent methyltransferase
MNSSDRQTHWENVYRTKSDREVSWFEHSPALSLDLIHATGAGHKAAIIDIGGGASRLVDALLDDGFEDVSVLDLSEAALATSQARLGARAAPVDWLLADVTVWEPPRAYDVWHDRAVFHFLTQPEDRAAYAACAFKGVRAGGHVIIGTFAPDGPERCSGLPVMRHDAASIGAVLGDAFTLVESRQHDHRTPAGAIQRFQFSRFKKNA